MGQSVDTGPSAKRGVCMCVLAITQGHIIHHHILSTL